MDSNDLGARTSEARHRARRDPVPRGDRMDDVRALHRIARGPEPGLGGATVGADLLKDGVQPIRSAPHIGRVWIGLFALLQDLGKAGEYVRHPGTSGPGLNPREKQRGKQVVGEYPDVLPTDAEAVDGAMGSLEGPIPRAESTFLHRCPGPLLADRADAIRCPWADRDYPSSHVNHSIPGPYGSSPALILLTLIAVSTNSASLAQSPTTILRSDV